MRERARGHRPSRPEPPAPPHCSCSATPTCSRPPTTCRPCCETNPIGLEGYDDQLIKNMIAKRRLAAERALLPDGRAWLYAEFGHDDPDEATALAEQRAGSRQGRPAARGQADHRQGRAGQRLEGARVGRRRQPRARLHGRRGQLGGRGRPPGQARRLPARLPEDPRRPRLPLRLLRPLRPGLRAHPDGLRPQDRRRGQDVPLVHGEVRRPGRRPTAARWPASTARATAAPSSCPRCSAPS